MALYSKRLQSLGDLEREKARLHRQLEELDSQPLIAEKTLPWNNLKGLASNGIFSKIVALAPMAKSPIIQGVIEMVKSKIFSSEPTANNTVARPPVNGEKPKKGNKKKDTPILLTIGLEVAKGYLAWKAIQLSYRGARYLFNKYNSKSDTTNQP